MKHPTNFCRTFPNNALT